MADPLTGIVAARHAAAMVSRGEGGRVIVAMSGVVRAALASERRRDPLALTQALRDWANARGQPFGMSATPC